MGINRLRRYIKDLNQTQIGSDSIPSGQVAISNGSGSWSYQAAALVPPHVITVSPSGSNYTSVKSAVDSITSPTATNQYVVDVAPGVYIEDTITLSQYITIRGQDPHATTIQALHNDRHLIIGAGDAVIKDVMLTGPTDTGKAAISLTGTASRRFHAQNVIINSGYYGVLINGTTGNVRAQLDFVTNKTTSTFQDFIRITGNSTVSIERAEFVNLTSPTITGYMIYASGASVSVNIVNLEHDCAGTNGIKADDGAVIKMVSSIFSNGTTAITIGSVGTGTAVYTTGTTIRDAYTTDVLIQNVNATVAFNGKAHRDKITNTVGAKFIGAFVDDTTNVEGQAVMGELWLGTTAAQMPLGSYSQHVACTGVRSGAGTYISGGLNAMIESGSVYINNGTSVRRYNFPQQVFACRANQSAWIYVNSSCVITSSVSEPAYSSNAILAAVITNSSSITFMTDHRVNLQDSLTAIYEFIEETAGTIVSSGCAVTKYATTGSGFSVDAGTYWFAGFERDLDGTSAGSASFSYWHRTGSAWIATSGNNKVDPKHYNSGSYWIATPAGEYTRQTVYVTTDASTEKYHVVFGQTAYASTGSALAGTNPTAPTLIDKYGLLLATLIVRSGSGAIVSVVDERPYLGSVATAATSVTDHGLLAGLADDDHPQYFLANGSRNMAGILNMGGFAITNVGNVDGVDVSGHAARHLPGAADALNIGTPVSVGIANAVGTSASFSRADHVHNHGIQTGSWMHATASTSLAGFMSATDKTNLNSLQTNFGGTKEVFFRAVGNTVANGYSTTPITTNGNATFTFAVPSNFTTLVSASLICFSAATGTGKNVDLSSTYGALNESRAAHTGTDTTSTYTFPTAGTIFAISMNSVFTSLGAGDFCGVTVTQNAVGGTTSVLGVRLQYT